MPDINTKAELLKKAYREVDYRGKSFWIAVVEAYEKALEQEDMKERMGEYKASPAAISRRKRE